MRIDVLEWSQLIVMSRDYRAERCILIAVLLKAVVYVHLVPVRMLHGIIHTAPVSSPGDVESGIDVVQISSIISIPESRWVQKWASPAKDNYQNFYEFPNLVPRAAYVMVLLPPST